MQHTVRPQPRVAHLEPVDDVAARDAPVDLARRHLVGHGVRVGAVDDRFDFCNDGEVLLEQLRRADGHNHHHVGPTVNCRGGYNRTGVGVEPRQHLIQLAKLGLDAPLACRDHPGANQRAHVRNRAHQRTQYRHERVDDGRQFSWPDPELSSI